ERQPWEIADGTEDRRPLGHPQVIKGISVAEGRRGEDDAEQDRRENEGENGFAMAHGPQYISPRPAPCQVADPLIWSSQVQHLSVRSFPHLSSTKAAPPSMRFSRLITAELKAERLARRA